MQGESGRGEGPAGVAEATARVNLCPYGCVGELDGLSRSVR